MTDRQAKQYHMLMRLKEFGAAYANRFPEDAPAHEAFAAIGEALNQLEAFAVQRLAAKKQDVRARALAREALVKIMEDISRSARLLKAEEPDFPHTFLMPVQESAEALLTTARLFLEQVEPLAARFREHSMGKTFPENFKQLLERYEDAIEGRERGKGLNKAAKQRLAEAITSGLTAARRLDIIVRQELAHDAAAIVDWRRSRRIGYRVGKTQPEDAVVTPAPAPAIVGEPSAATVSSVPIDLDVGDSPGATTPPSDAALQVAAETAGDEAA